MLLIALDTGFEQVSRASYVSMRSIHNALVKRLPEACERGRPLA